MVAVEGCLWYKYVAGREARVGAVPFLQNNYCVLHMAVHKVNPEVDTSCLPTPTALN